MYLRSGVLPSPGGGGRDRVGCSKEIYLFIWYMSNTLTFRQLANLFGISKSASWNTIVRVSSWIVSIAHEFIKWPEANEVPLVEMGFYRKRSIPGIIGAIDCAHFKINRPKDNAIKYFNRNHYYSLNLQAIVDADKKFLDIHCGEPGSLHDARVLRRSPFFSDVIANQNVIFPNNTFIIGDSAYPNNSWIVPPFRDTGRLTDQQKHFNFIHSSTRIVVENAFGLLRVRFRRVMHFMEQKNNHLAINLIVCACVLHNICIIQNDHLSNDNENFLNNNEYIGNEDANANDPNCRRDQLFNHLLNSNIL